ncbi:esterase-like activity of phytase family protein [Sphingomonas sp.]|uniref:esterase-like activity of phytase family protein n=1 Tax=Sphingomonas sp. TaxID=28214 RepID=UPI00286AC765|nr:esterase-like activity of phytase family protein [Sphingomonas sp.]
MALMVLGAHRWLAGLPDRAPGADGVAAVRFEAVALDTAGFAPLTVAGAWHVTSADPRMGGVSALAVDRGALLALTDSGVMVRLPKPVAARGMAEFRDLPEGPGPNFFKAGRDSEALALDHDGRGWWVGFENRHAAWLFDRDFQRVIQKVNLKPLGWLANKGAEGAVSDRHGLLLFPENGDEMVRIGADGVRRIALDNPFGRWSDAVLMPDARVVVVARNFSPTGFSSRLVLLDQPTLKPLANLALGRLDNAEAIAAEPLTGGGIRLWVMTDNDFRRRVPTLLVALDWRGDQPRQ